MSTPSETLRAAAKKTRNTAEKATPGPWISLDNGDRIIRDKQGALVRHFVDGTQIIEEEAPEYVIDEPLIANPDNGEHIALWHPGVALAVAEWLEHAADSMSDENAAEVEVTYGNNVLAEVMGDTGGHLNRPSEWTAALAVARAILGEVQS